MEAVKVCRICLIMDVKLHDLRSYPLQSYYWSVMETNKIINFLHIDTSGPKSPIKNLRDMKPLYNNLPPYACYECAALMRKFYYFRQKSQRSQALLFGLSDNYGKITSADVNTVDRDSLNITSNLTVNTLLEIHIIPNTETDEKIKEEVNDDIRLNFAEEESIKSEDHYEGFPLVDHGLSSDDDEPLSHHKEKKNQENIKVCVINEINDEKKLKKEKEHIQFAEDSDNEISEFPIKKAETSKKKKRGRHKKAMTAKKEFKNPILADDGFSDLEQYLTIITLSMEEQVEEINKRKESSNYLNSPYKCELCYKGFIDTDAWNHHVSKHSESAGSIVCVVCKFRFKTKRALQKHAANHEKKFACKSCPYVSSNKTQAKQHQGWHKGITFKCKYCDEIFTVWTSYMSHMRIKHPSEFICGICGYSFISKLGLNMHKTMMHKNQVKEEKNDEDGPYCAECDVKFISSEAYKRHMVMSVKHTQTTDSIKGCRTCGATFEDSEELRLHHRNEHTRRRPKNYGKKPANTTWPAKCEHCLAEIPNAREYWTHFRRVHPDKEYPIQKNYICDICGKSFRGNAFLVYHKRTHSEDRNYKCAQCGKAFYNRANLQVHEKTHSDKRPYSCSICFKGFKNKGALDRHFRVHGELYSVSDMRPFPCSVCNKAFKFKGALDRHALSHTGQKPYSCEVCGKCFTQSNSRNLHVRTVHLKQPAPYVSRTRRQRREHREPHLPDFYSDADRIPTDLLVLGKH